MDPFPFPFAFCRFGRVRPYAATWRQVGACLALIACATWLAPQAAAQAAPDPGTDNLRRAQEREAQERLRHEPSPEVRLPRPPAAATSRLPEGESPCLVIRALQLQGDGDGRFSWLVAHANGELPDDPVLGRCLGAVGIQQVVDRLQNALIAQGWVTTRVLAPAQDLASGVLTLQLIPGQLRAIEWAPGAGERASRWNVVPARPGEPLNLRDIEQALENYLRVPTAQAGIQVAPGSDPGTSDLIVSHQQATAFRLSATADDSGSRQTGRWQGSLTLSYDNGLTLSDLFYLTLLRDLGGGEPGARGTRGHIAHYSVPFGYWLLGLTHSRNRYHQTVAGASQDYLYSGGGHTTEVKLSRVLHRDATGKTVASLRGLRRDSRNFIDDTEIEVQRRVVGAWEAALAHRLGWPGGSLDANIQYRRGTGAWNSLPAPEQAFGEGSSRMRLRLLDASVQQSLGQGSNALRYHGSWRLQHEHTPLSPQDRFAIGGRHTVRGFDGASVLMAERGWFLRNEFSAPVAPGWQAFVGIDTGQVGGPSAGALVGRRLTGGVLGLRGQWQRLHHEAFVGRPLRKPDNFQTSRVTTGISLGVSF